MWRFPYPAIASLLPIPDPAPNATGPQKLLLVENDRPLADALDRVLRGAGYRITRADDGAAALREAVSQRFAAVILDLALAGLDGFSVLLGLRASRGICPVITLGTSQDPAEGAQALQHGAAVHLVKSEAFAEDLLGVVREFTATGR